MALEPTTTSLQMRCRNCRGLLDGQMLTNVPIGVAVESMKVIHCPHCGAGWKKLSIGQSRTASEDDTLRRVGVDAPVESRAADWQVTGEQGSSADAIRRTMTGVSAKEFPHPRDVGDLHRCMLLLRRIPEWEVRIDEMASRSAEWRAIAEMWPKLAASFREEAGPDLAIWPRPKTGEILQAAMMAVPA